MGTPQELIEQYRDAFSRSDLDALVEFFGFPLQVVSVTEAAAVSVVQRTDWTVVLERLLDTYRRLGVVTAVPLALDVNQPMEAVAFVQVQWELKGQDDRTIYDFAAVYTLMRTEGQLRIVSVAHNELPKLRAAMNAR
jgi:hypothetical protein